VPAFDFKREDVVGVTLTRGKDSTSLEFQDNKWLIKQPIDTMADESTMNSLVGDLVSARIDRDFPASGDQLKSYGLAEPAVKLEIKLKNGQTHRLELGTRDPLGSSAYARIDGSQNIALLPASLLSNSDKSHNDLRDRSVFGVTQYELSTVKIKNEKGGFELVKKDSDWFIKSPVEGPSEENEVGSLLSEVTTARAVEFVSEAADDPAKYGLDKAKVSFTSQLTTGGERILSIGAKIDDKYYAKVSDRPQIFKVESSLYDKLNTGYATLRSKSFVKINRDELTRVQLKNPNLTLVVEKNSEGKWLVKEPQDKKDKEAYSYKFIDPMEVKATEVIDRPGGAIASKLAKPAVEVRLTGKDGKVTVIHVSSADGENVYVRVEGRPEVYKVGKSLVESLTFKIDEAISST
ncbi:MAG: DUF4340 domain-containing protein, partial [Acidobacteria bacterium]|nr:DUF4340 domain-containing protein [Acidobacteriota bacterium]